MAKRSKITGLRHADAYRQMRTIRGLEERCIELGADGTITGSIHVCAGQEAIAVGARAALRSEDRILATYRGHGWALAAGVPLLDLLAEICQRAGGVSGGRGGSPYFTAPQHGFLGENSIVGAHVPIAAGVAMATQAKSDGRVVLASIGDGAMNQGSVHEALVFATARKLPLILVCENNGWAEMTPTASTALLEDLADRAAAYGIPGRVVDGCDPAAVHDAVRRAADDARRGAGPALLECKAVRLLGHYNRDIEHYRPKADVAAAEAADPIRRLRAQLLETGECSEVELDEINADVARAVDAATEQVRAMPAPDPATAREHVYAQPDSPAPPVRPSDADGTELTYIKAVTAALRDALASRPEVLVYGEDVGAAGGIFGASRGLQQEFGAGRVFDTPIAESAILGSAVGAAMEGMRPIVEIMWGDFLLVALDQLFNQAANVRYVSRSELAAPLVVRTQQGVTPGSCAQHSQSLEALLAHVPGLRVGLAATPQDAYAMLRSAVADPDPCIVIESRALYQLKGPVALDGPVEPIGGARWHRAGGDLSIVTWGPMLHPVLRAADRLAEQGIDAAVVDLRWLNPLDDVSIARAVEEGEGRVMLVHEANVTGGFGAEVVARIQERHFDLLDAPVVRLGTPDVRIPSAPALQEALVPGTETVVESARALVADTQSSAALVAP